MERVKSTYGDFDAIISEDEGSISGSELCVGLKVILELLGFCPGRLGRCCTIGNVRLVSQATAKGIKVWMSRDSG